MRLILKYGAQSHELELGEDASLGDLVQAAERVTDVFQREQKILCKGRVIVDPSATIRSSSSLKSLGCVDGSKLMLWAAGPQARRPAPKQAARDALPGPARVAKTAQRGPNLPSGILERQSRAWQATGIAVLEPPLTPALERWPQALTDSAPGLRTLRCHKVTFLPQQPSLPSPLPCFPLHIFARLQQLVLTDCRLEQIDWAGLGQLAGLTRLCLAGNALERVDGLGPGSLPQLKELDLSRNRLGECIGYGD